MKLREIEISGYRSIPELRLLLSPGLTVVVGANGTGKSNIYQSIALLASAANGTFNRRIMQEGGIRSIIWAGGGDNRIKLAVRFEDLGYEISFGRIPISERPNDYSPPPITDIELDFDGEPSVVAFDWLADRKFQDTNEGLTFFSNDPDIKEERIEFIDGKKKSMLFQRKRGILEGRDINGRRYNAMAEFGGNESALAELVEPKNYPELHVLRNRFMKWRFYHDFRTDFDSPIRQPQIATMTSVVNNDGTDLIPALATIEALGDRDRLRSAFQQAFPGHTYMFHMEDGDMTFRASVPGLHRPLTMLELSDGTVQYLCLLAALLSPRPAPLTVLNEPETSIHPNLYKPIADLILDASKFSQIFMTTHAHELADYIKRKGTNAQVIELVKEEGATRVRGSNRLAKYGNAFTCED